MPLFNHSLWLRPTPFINSNQMSKGLNLSYTLLSPFYNLVVKRATAAMRQYSIAKLDLTKDQTILIGGIGTGLDIPYLPNDAKYVAIDMNAAMLELAKHVIPPHLCLYLHRGSIMQLPYADNSFDKILLHLIVSVAGDPIKTLKEVSRVLKPGGTVNIVDKFIPAGKRAPLRRLISPIMRHIATRTDIVIENALHTVPEFKCVEDTPMLLNGWFRFLQLKKQI